MSVLCTFNIQLCKGCNDECLHRHDQVLMLLSMQTFYHCQRVLSVNIGNYSTTVVIDLHSCCERQLVSIKQRFDRLSQWSGTKMIVDLVGQSEIKSLF